DQGFNSWG
uniref:Leucokinin-3 n=1 Tax=Rhyparobia maderae TaxID=36963 RepID=LCK3_RHYMA|nr:RecName: Full=Leucokinin-3; AltName: Full=Leucokinin III; Short=L-III [Rhyparobia maderae]